jgi:hypothetical protein
MSRRTIENCKVIKSVVKDGIEKPLIEVLNGKIYCQGYQKNESDDEPYEGCINCHINIFYES